MGPLEAVIRRAVPPLSDSGSDAFDVLPGGLDDDGRAQVAAAAAGLPQQFERLSASMDDIAMRFDAFAVAMSQAVARVSRDDKESYKYVNPLRGQAGQLQLLADLVDGVYRRLVYIKLVAELSGDSMPPWAAWLPWHGIQIGLTATSANTREMVLSRLGENDVKRISLAGEGAKQLAADLRVYAGLVRGALKGPKMSYDFGGLMRRTRTLGHLESLQAEYEFISTCLKPVGTNDLNAVRAKLKGASTARVAVGERVLLQLQAADQALGAAPAQLPAAVARLQTAEGMATAADEGRSTESLAAARRRLQGAAAGAAATQTVREARVAIEREIDALQAAVQLPPPNIVRRSNLRAGQAMAGLWPIDATVRSYDQRWLSLMQESELALTRRILAMALPPFEQKDAARRLKLQYAALMELRAQQLAGERRRNAGITFLEGDAGPRLRLPKHIAEEFFRARNRKVPEQFKEWTERYYEELYRDVAQ